MTRPETVILPAPEAPFPITQKSVVISGFGRGSSELGIPTANIPINDDLNQLETGIYYGWCKLTPCTKDDECKTRNDGNEILFDHGKKLAGSDLQVLPMVMSIGWNPFYDNKEKAAEVHIMHKFADNFYGAEIAFNVLGYIRPELNYTTKEALIEDINLDIKIALEILDKDSYKTYKDKL
ncbi:riboflavin kinase [Scheffersomyces xylosifermentans]|uniref:riboflavin kinase n=1 Tax=Scheffersomyces xylosifermentans TaxID=1304137 RepID=UPI00315D425E